MTMNLVITHIAKIQYNKAIKKLGILQNLQNLVLQSNSQKII